MTTPKLTVRARLTLLYTALFAGCGAVVVAITYGLLARSLRGLPPKQAAAVDPFRVTCADALRSADVNPDLRAKCAAVLQQTVKTTLLDRQGATLDHLLTYSLITLAAVTAASALAGWIVAGRVLRPVHRITAAARAASEHNLAQRVALDGPRDELRELADTFDAMLDRLQAAFAGQRRFIANASHELRTPLAVMRTAVDVVLAKPAATTAELTAMGRDVRAAVDRADALIDALLTLARNDRGLTTRESVDLATVAEDVLDATDPHGLRVGAALEPAPTLGDRVLLERLVANLVDNAVRYNEPGGTLAVATSMMDGNARLVVTNTGPVIDPSAVGALFEPFRRLHERTGSDGVGLGLAIVASVAAVHGGSVAAAAPPDGGLAVTVTLPALAPPDRPALRAGGRVAPADSDAPRHGSGTRP